MSSQCSIKRKRNIKQVNYTKYAMRASHNIMLKYHSVIQILAQEFTNYEVTYYKFTTCQHDGFYQCCNRNVFIVTMYLKRYVSSSSQWNLPPGWVSFKKLFIKLKALPCMCSKNLPHLEVWYTCRLYC